jgi:molybdopterin synthase sulfur carrier subunit
MSVSVRIPTPLRTLTGGHEEISLDAAATVADAIEQLEKRHPGLRDRLLDAKGVRKFINIYVGEEDIRFLEGLQTKLDAGAQISIVPAIAGGVGGAGGAGAGSGDA